MIMKIKNNNKIKITYLIKIIYNNKSMIFQQKSNNKIQNTTIYKKSINNKVKIINIK